MSVLVDFVVSYPSAEENLEEYRNKLRSKTDIILSEAAASTQNGNSTVLLDLIHSVQISNCSAGIALLLSLQSDHLNDRVFPFFVLQCKKFFVEAVKSHMIFANKEVTKFLQKVVDVAIQLHRPRSVVNLLQEAVKILSPNENCLTTAHALLLQCCIKGQVYDVAVSFLRSVDIFEIDTKNATIGGVDFLKYFYYAGICYIAAADYPSALASFFQCMSAPAHALSNIVVSAVKKAKLVALIHYGRELFVSAPMSGCVSRFVKAALPVYDPIGKAFALDDSKGLSLALEQGAEQLIKDGNMGLAQRVLASLPTHRLRRLGATFISLSLADIATRVELSSAEAAEKALLCLVRSGELSVTIDPTSGFVFFEDQAGVCGTSDHAKSSSSGTGGKALQSPQAAAQLGAYLSETMALSNRLQELHRTALLSTKCILKTAVGRSMTLGMGPAMGMGGGMGVGSMGEYQMDLS